ADVFDALTSRRVYKPAWSREDAARAIREGAGRMFDPAVVAAFDSLMRNGGIDVSDTTSPADKSSDIGASS
ncbi:MAG: hypothetical protein KDA33_06790, partial [Phycisphaerales bacterium]|nr:hypothetical protein [Phycisphaerales bacterium]